MAYEDDLLISSSYAILLLKTFTEYLVVWVFVQAQKARSLRCQAYWLLTSSGKLARDCEHIGQKHRTSCYR